MVSIHARNPLHGSPRGTLSPPCHSEVMGKPPYLVAHNGTLKALYDEIATLHRENTRLLKTMEGHDEDVWATIHAKDERIAKLWREIYDIEQLWPKG